MNWITSGDLVRMAGGQCEMMIVGSADDEHAVVGDAPTWFCVWESNHRLFERVYSENELIVIRKERRRIPRGGDMNFPSDDL